MTAQEHKPAAPEGADAYAALAGEILRRHNRGDSEADIRSAVRDFMIQTNLVAANEVSQEESPTEGAAGRVDLAARDAFFEFKRNLYSGSSIDPEHVNQLDNYLTDAPHRRQGYPRRCFDRRPAVAAAPHRRRPGGRDQPANVDAGGGGRRPAALRMAA